MYTLKINDLTKDHINLLRNLTKEPAEYRDTEYKNLTEFIKKNPGGDPNRFLSRNSNGTYYLLDELFKYGFIDNCIDSWHVTVELTEIGKIFLEQNSNV